MSAAAARSGAKGDVTIIREPGRTIIRDNDRTIIRRDETQRFRDLGFEGRTERRGNENRSVFERPDGTRIITVTDEEGRLIRRTRQTRDGEELVIIDNTRRDRPEALLGRDRRAAAGRRCRCRASATSSMPSRPMSA